MLSERKKKILKAVIDNNIENGSPVSSKELQEKYMQHISSATIRNELMALEEMGFLFQPHTSSGRLPTANGFRQYIDEILADESLSDEQLSDLSDKISGHVENIEDLAVSTARILSSETNYASIVVLGGMGNATLKSVKLVKLTENLGLVVLVTDMGVIKDITIEFSESTNEEDCLLVSSLLTNALAGKVVGEINTLETGIEIGNILAKYKAVCNQVIDAIVNRKEKKITKIDGASNLLNLPEYKDVEKAQKALQLFEHTENLTPILEKGEGLEVSIQIGESELEDCSLVSLNYKAGGRPIGRAGVIGPMRMDYKKVIKVLKQLNRTFEKSYNETLKNKKEKDKNDD